MKKTTSKPKNRKKKSIKGKKNKSKGHLEGTNMVTCVWDPYSSEWCNGMDDCNANNSFDCSLLADPTPPEDYHTEEVECLPQLVGAKGKRGKSEEFREQEDALAMDTKIERIKETLANADDDVADIIEAADRLIKSKSPARKRRFAKKAKKILKNWEPDLGNRNLDKDIEKNLKKLKSILKYVKDTAKPKPMGCGSKKKCPQKKAVRRK